MAVQLDDIVAHIKGDTSDINAKFDELRKRLDGVGETAQKTGSMLGNFIKPAVFTTAGIGINKYLTEPMVGFAKSAVSAASQLEQATIAYKTMLGSGEAAQQMLNEMRAFAAGTPFEFPDLLEAGKRMLAFGFESKQIIPLLTNVGDAVAGVGGNAGVMNRVILAMGQIQSKGQLMAQEMRQLAEAGIPAWEFLAKHLKVTIPEAMDMVTKKQVSGAEALTALQAGMAQKFGGLMAEQSKTVEGMMSNLRDTIGFIMTDIGAEIIKTLNLKEVIASIREFAEGFLTWFKSLDEGTKRTVLILTGAFAASGPILVAVGAFMAAMTVITAPMLATGAIVTGIVAGVALIIGHWTSIKEKAVAIWTGLVSAITGTAKAIYEGIKTWLVDKLNAILTPIRNFSNSVKGVFQELGKVLVFQSIVPDMIDAIENQFNRLKENAMLRPVRIASQGVRKTFADLSKESQEYSKQFFGDMMKADELRQKRAYQGSGVRSSNSEVNRNAILSMQAEIAAGIEARKRADENYRIESMQMADEAFTHELMLQQKSEGAYQEFLGKRITEDAIARQQMKFGWGDVFGSMSQSAQFAFGAIRSQFANTIADMVEGTASWRDFWKASQRALITSSVNWAIDIVGSFIAKNAMILATEGATALGVTSIWTGTFAAVTGGFAAMSSAIALFFTGTIIPMFAAVGTAVATFLSSIASALTLSIFGAPFSVPVWAAVGLVLAAVGVISAFAFGAFAEGGIVKGPMMGLVGEAGPEAIIPLDQLGSIMGGGSTTVIVELDGRTLSKAVFDNMPSVMRVRGMSA